MSNEQSKRGHLDRINDASEKNDSEMGPLEENLVRKVRVYDAWLQFDRANHCDQYAQNEVDQEGAEHVGQPRNVPFDAHDAQILLQIQPLYIYTFLGHFKA